MEEKALKRRINYCDIAAIAAGILMFGWFFRRVHYGAGYVDESFYIEIVKRIMQGDRVIVDEWHFSQMASLFLYIPVKLYLKINGSFDGVILFSRLLYICVHFIIYAFIYYKLRSYKWYGLIVALLFGSYTSFAVYTLNYHTMPAHGLIIITLTLFLAEKKVSALKLLFLGIILGCVVLIQPALIFLFILYTAIVFIRFFKSKKANKESCDYVFGVRTWLIMTAAAAVLAVILFVFLGVKVGYKDIFAVMPHFLDNSEYDLTTGGNVYKFIFLKILYVAGLYGYFGAVFSIILIILAFVYKFSKKKNTRLRDIILIVSTVVLIASLIVVSVAKLRTDEIGIVIYYCAYTIPPFIFALICYILSEKPNKKYFLFMLTGLFGSLCMDAFSDISIGVLMNLAYIGDILIIKDLIEELRGDEKKSIFSSPYTTCVCAVLGIFLLWNCFNTYSATTNHICENFTTQMNNAVLDVKIDYGELKGIYTTQLIKDEYDGNHEDIKFIEDNSNGNLYIANLASNLYLTADMKCGAYTPWYIEADFPQRQLKYWELHPEKTPDYIYINFHAYYYFVNEEKRNDNMFTIETVQSIADCEVTKGKGGYIIKINKFKNQ